MKSSNRDMEQTQGLNFYLASYKDLDVNPLYKTKLNNKNQTKAKYKCILFSYSSAYEGKELIFYLSIFKGTWLD